MTKHQNDKNLSEKMKVKVGLLGRIVDIGSCGFLEEKQIIISQHGIEESQFEIQVLS